MRIALTLNARPVEADIEPRTLLSDFLRDHAGLTGTHVGCETGQCGACTVHLDGKAVKSCLVLAAQADGRAVTTIEGIASPTGRPHPLQQSLRDHHGVQCGFCTPGMVMAGLELISRHPDGDPAAIAEGLSGNLCRCTGYRPIVDAIAATCRKSE